MKKLLLFRKSRRVTMKYESSPYEKKRQCMFCNTVFAGTNFSKWAYPEGG